MQKLLKQIMTTFKFQLGKFMNPLTRHVGIFTNSYLELHDPFLEPLIDVHVEAFLDSDPAVSLPFNATYRISERNLYKEIKICLEALIQSKKNLPSYKQLIQKNRQIGELRACQNLATLLCLAGIPFTLAVGAIACHSYLAFRVQSLATPLLLSLSKTLDARDTSHSIYRRNDSEARRV